MLAVDLRDARNVSSSRDVGVGSPPSRASDAGGTRDEGAGDGREGEVRDSQGGDPFHLVLPVAEKALVKSRRRRTCRRRASPGVGRACRYDDEPTDVARELVRWPRRPGRSTRGLWERFEEIADEAREIRHGRPGRQRPGQHTQGSKGANVDLTFEARLRLFGSVSAHVWTGDHLSSRSLEGWMRVS